MWFDYLNKSAKIEMLCIMRITYAPITLRVRHLGRVVFV